MKFTFKSKPLTVRCQLCPTRRTFTVAAYAEHLHKAHPEVVQSVVDARIRKARS